MTMDEFKKQLRVLIDNAVQNSHYNESELREEAAKMFGFPIDCNCCGSQMFCPHCDGDYM